jgi:hypothetical protein
MLLVCVMRLHILILKLVQLIFRVLSLHAIVYLVFTKDLQHLLKPEGYPHKIPISFSSDPPHLTLHHGFPTIQLSRR